MARNFGMQLLSSVIDLGMERFLRMIQLSPQEHISERTNEGTFPQERISERTQIDAPGPQILREIVDSVGSQNIVVIPEQEVCWNTERREKMSLRDSYPASQRTPD